MKNLFDAATPPNAAETTWQDIRTATGSTPATRNYSKRRKSVDRDESATGNFGYGNGRALPRKVRTSGLISREFSSGWVRFAIRAFFTHLFPFVQSCGRIRANPEIGTNVDSRATSA
jgi:hypothetical protein